MKSIFVIILVILQSMFLSLTMPCFIKSKMTKLVPHTSKRQCEPVIFQKSYDYSFPNKILELSDKICIDDTIISLYADTAIINEIDRYVILTKIFYIVNAHIEMSQRVIDIHERTKKRLLLFLDAVDIYFDTNPYIFKTFSRVKCTYEIKNNISQFEIENSCCLNINLVVKECNLFGKLCHFVVRTELYDIDYE